MSATSRLDVKTRAGTISGMWEMDENERRIAIAKRASKGAARTLGRRDVIRVEAPKVTLLPDAVVIDPKLSSWRRIIFETAIKHTVPPKDITGPFRDRNIVAARHEVFWRMRNELNFSLCRIGQLVGDRDHTTVRSGILAHQRRQAAKQHSPLSTVFTGDSQAPLTPVPIGQDASC